MSESIVSRRLLERRQEEEERLPKPRVIAERWKQVGRRQKVFGAFSLATAVGDANGFNDDIVMPRCARALQRLKKEGLIVRHADYGRGWYRWIRR